MSEITCLAIDLAKRVFQLYGVNARGVAVLQRRVARKQLLPILAHIPPCRVVMEAGAASHYWARQIRALGHQPRLIAGHYVKAFSRGQKNDYNDAQAIASAAAQAYLPSVAIKSEEQQAILALHRLRERMMKERVQLTNQLHGLLGEFGLLLPRGLAGLRRELTLLLEQRVLPAMLQAPITQQLEHLSCIEQRLKALTVQIESLVKASESCQRLMRLRGVGPLIASAFVAEIADPNLFRNGRQVGACLGLVPQQHSSGSRQRLLGITKRGDRYLRKLLIHGARAALRTAGKHPDRISQWALAVQERRGRNKASVALANKLARHLWAALRYEDYTPAATV